MEIERGIGIGINTWGCLYKDGRPGLLVVVRCYVLRYAASGFSGGGAGVCLSGTMEMSMKAWWGCRRRRHGSGHPRPVELP